MFMYDANCICAYKYQILVSNKNYGNSEIWVCNNVCSICVI
jgi:hypothetical protein